VAKNRRNGAPKPRKFVEELLVELSNMQLQDKREQLEQVALRRADLATKKSAQLKLLNDEDKKLEITYDQLLEVLRAKGEKQAVECEETFDFDTNTAVTRRTDTDEVVRERAIDADERDRLAQGELPVETTPKNGTPAEA
jgi:aspartyl/asparaginyl-tRNA synthetase